MIIKRDIYLNKLIAKQGNGLIKVITGIRRCGKSFLLLNLFHTYLRTEGIPEEQIIEIVLDDRRNQRLRDPDAMLAFIDSKIEDPHKQYYVIIDEVQLLDEFVDVLNSLLHMPNVDTYVTGSNSRFLSTDVATEFRGRGDQIRIHPLSFAEYYEVSGLDKNSALNEYLLYGGIPLVLEQNSPQEKAAYLSSLLSEVYLVDTVDRYNLKNSTGLEELVDILASGIGSPLSPNKIANTFQSELKTALSYKTIRHYLECLKEVFLITEAKRFDIRGRHYINSPSKYYFEDQGLRNARLNFRQIDEGHLLENVIHNELVRRGYSVDVGSIETFGKTKDGKTMRQQLEVDFVVNRGSYKCYIQSAWEMKSTEKIQQEKRALSKVEDGFRRIILVKEPLMTHFDENGIQVMDVMEFLLDQDSLKTYIGI